MKAVNIKARAGGEWRYRVLERVPGWGFLVGVKSLSRTGAEGWMCHRRPGDLWGPTACAVPPQAIAGETKREPALCGQLQPSAKGSRERQRAGDGGRVDCRWEEAGGVKREESALRRFRTTTQETHTCVNHQRFSPVTLCDLWPGMCSWVLR